MRGKYRVLLSIITVFTLLAGAYALGMTRHRVESEGRVTSPAPTKRDAAPPTDARFAARAFTDMQNLARREFGAFRLQPDSFGGTEDWSREHVLHWVTFERDGREIRLYHLTEKKHPEHRQMAMWSSRERSPTRWQPTR